MAQLFKLPNGKVVELYNHPLWFPLKHCERCNRQVTRLHEHHTKKGESVLAKSEWMKRDG